MQLWSAFQGEDETPPFAHSQDLGNCIDSIEVGGISWESFSVSYEGSRPTEEETLSWMLQEYDVWFRCPRRALHEQIGNPDFADEMDYAPKRVYRRLNNKREYEDFMSGNWAWRQAV